LISGDGGCCGNGAGTALIPILTDQSDLADRPPMATKL